MMNNPAIIYRSFAELAEWRALELESYILSEIYEPMWYHYNAGINENGDIAVWVFNNEERIECTSSRADKDCKDRIAGEMSQMVAQISAKDEFYIVGIKQRELGRDFRIGISCPNQWGECHSVLGALQTASYDTYNDIRGMLRTLAHMIKQLCSDDIEPQWLKISGIDHQVLGIGTF